VHAAAALFLNGARPHNEFCCSFFPQRGARPYYGVCVLRPQFAFPRHGKCAIAALIYDPLSARCGAHFVSEYQMHHSLVLALELFGFMQIIRAHPNGGERVNWSCGGWPLNAWVAPKYYLVHFNSSSWTILQVKKLNSAADPTISEFYKNSCFSLEI
jgi:hypothetical protein